MIDHLVRLRRGAGLSMTGLSLAADVVAALAFVILASYLWSKANGYVVLAGGIPSPSITYLKALLASEGLHLRIFWWSCAWAAAVFSAGALLLAIAGGHRVWQSTSALLSR